MAWIFLNDAFYSIVRDKQRPKDLLVRARAKGDIERTWEKAKVVQLPGRDYAFRAWIPEQEVASALAFRILGIGYGNFKSSVHEQARHDAYLGVWSVMYRYQEAQRRPQFDPWAEAEELDAMGDVEPLKTASPKKGKQCQNKGKASPRRK